MAPDLDNLFWISSIWLKIENFKVMYLPEIPLALKLGGQRMDHFYGWNCRQK
jgi:hypothetical protein